jgi:3-oxoacyl-[acyl-carrier protein] reductase
MSHLAQSFEPQHWRSHRFGLAPRRWDRLTGRTIMVTGAGTGIGRSVSIALSAAGAQVVLCGRRTERLNETLDAMRQLGLSAACWARALDVRDPQAVASVTAEISAQFGAISGVVHSAALPPPPVGPWALADTPVASWQDEMATNVAGPWLLTRALLAPAPPPLFRAVFLTSAAAWGFAAGAGPYNVSKAALNSLVSSFAAEYAARYPDADLQFNAVDPGQVRSEMNPAAALSPFSAVPIVLLLLSTSPQGPNGRFFRVDGSSVGFGHAAAYDRDLLLV